MMAPNYKLYSGFTVRDALEAAGAPKYTSQFATGEPPVTFFTQAPKDSAAVFSTHGQRPFRQVANPTYEREGYFWWAAEIQRVCDELRRNLPEVCKKIEAPQSYWDLYKYFDAYDIYYRGAQNLWNVINTFVFENEYAQGLVEKEKKLQTEQYTPLFEFLAAELLKKPEVQTKLLSWDKEKQQDILDVLTMDELQNFEGYEEYPKHFQEAIRMIFSRHYADLQKGLSFAHCLSSAESGISKVDVPEKLTALRLYLQHTANEDPFMNKFDIPNKIINGIVIVDGTSKTAARRARMKEILATNSHNPQRAAQDHCATGLPHGNAVPIPHVSCYPESGNANHTNGHRPTPKRCSSAPSIGGEPGIILSPPVNDEARVYPGKSHEGDEKLTGCQKPVTQNAMQVAMHAVGGEPQHLSMENQLPPPIRYDDGPRRATDHQFSPDQQPILSHPSNSLPGPMSPDRPSGIQGHGMPQGPFANQIPTHTLPQQHGQAPPQTMQQAHQPYLVRMPPNGGGYFANAIPPYSNTGPRQPYNAPPAHSHRSESFGQQKRNSVSRNFSSGQWQRIGSDDIHGPKVVFRKGSDAAGRRTSATSINSRDRRFSNTSHSQQFSNQMGPRQADQVRTTTRSNSRTSANMGYSLSEYGCVNAGKLRNLFTKFDPCPCTSCRDRDRTIFVSRLRSNVGRDEETLDLLGQHFSKYGEVDRVTRLHGNMTAAHVTFVSPQTAVAAVHAASFVKIDGLGDTPLSVNFRTGSQFFTPRGGYNSVSSSNNHRDFTRNVPRERGLPMSPPPSSGLNQPDAYSTPFRQHYNSPEGPVISPTRMDSPGRSPVISPNAAIYNAINVLGRGATQTGFRMKEFNEGPDSRMAGSVTMPYHQASLTNCAFARSPVGHQPWYSSRIGEVPPHKTNRDLVRDITELTHEIMISGHASHHNTPSPAEQAAAPHSNTQGSPVGPLETGGSAKLEEGAVLDYSTVRVRPDKARYNRIPARWRGDTSPHTTDEVPSQPFEAASNRQSIQLILSPPKDSQQIEAAERHPEDVTARTQQSNGEETSPAEEHESRIRGTSVNSKRKAGETDDEDKAPGQPLHKKFAKTNQADEPVQQRQSSQPGQKQQNDRAGEASHTKPKKKKNKKPKNQVPPQVALDATAPAPYEAQTFEPAIAASQLPPYPQQVGNGLASQPTPTPLREPIYVHMLTAHAGPVNSRSNGPEPFPAYRDLMSGPQLPLKSHKSRISGLEHTRSFSSDASTIIQDFNQRGRALNPGADNFVPSPRSMSPGPNGMGRGNGNGKGKWKPKKGKGMRNDQKSASQGPVNRRLEFERPNGVKGGTFNKAKTPAHERQSSNGVKGDKGSHQRNGTGKADEQLAVKPIEAAPTSKAKPKNDKNDSNEEGLILFTSVFLLLGAENEKKTTDG
ncbi:hypothetical protein O1611_g7504 [Lasiodiplodia mahajangana]|uniref:Uncharacterized protein n=1 Tax=Lasiodiplodia mahajangana TaxID=1108764 RepID=A0ACC2JFX8_9PEZI|nr:hypothetical protein O1611_g7504 [Lasiodiplodia mahajangana]